MYSVSAAHQFGLYKKKQHIDRGGSDNVGGEMLLCEPPEGKCWKYLTLYDQVCFDVNTLPHQRYLFK